MDNSSQGYKSPQVEPSHYKSQDYETKRRFASYWHQINETRLLSPESVLEVGVGNGFVSEYLRRMGVDITTLDFDERLDPDVVGSVLDLPFEKDSFQVVACFEVLEHLPYEQFIPALKELRRAAQERVIISVPDAKKVYRVEVHLRHVFEKRWLIPRPWGRGEHKFDGQHYWEIGKADFPLHRVVNDIERANFEIEKTYRVFENPYHRFFVMRA